MSSAPKRRRGRGSPQRLLDYFAVVGLPPSVECPDGDFNSADADAEATEMPKAAADVTKPSFVPEVIDRFPRADDDARPFPAGLPLFCMVDGMQLQRGEFAPMPTFFTFRCAGAAGGWEGAVFAACLTFFEPLTPSQLDRLRDLGWHDGAGDEGEGAGSVDGSCESATAGPAISSLSLFAPKCICILSAFPFLTELRRLLTEFYRHSLSHMSLPIERYIVNFVLELPAPPRGLLEVRYVLPTAASAESDAGVLTFARAPANQPLSSSPLPFALAFDLLPTAVMLRLMTAVLLDRQVVVHSERLSLLTPVMEVLLSLLFPFRYCHLYLPVLPRGLLGVLQAPTPFFVGMRSRLFEQVCFRPADAGEAELRMPDDLVVLDLDQGVLLVPDTAPLPILPVKAGRKLQQSLKAALGNVHARRPPMWRQRMLEGADMAFAQSALPDDHEDSEGNDAGGSSPLTPSRRASWTRVLSGSPSTMLPQWEVVRDAALRFFVSCFRDYKNFLVFPTKDVPQPKMLFDVPRFLGTTASSDRAFFSRMLDTQAFQQFVDERVFVQAAASGSDVASGKAKAFTADVLFFDESIDAKHNRSLLRMNKRETPFLDSTAYAATKTYVALEPSAATTPPARRQTDTGIDGTPSAGRSDEAKHVYERFPELDDELFGEARYIPPFDLPGVDPSGTEVEPALALKTGNAAWRWREGRDAAEKATVNTAEERERTVISLWFGTFCESIALPDARQPLHTLESLGDSNPEGTKARTQSSAPPVVSTSSSARGSSGTCSHGRPRRDSAEERQRRMSADLSRNGALAELDLALEVLESSAVLGFCSNSGRAEGKDGGSSAPGVEKGTVATVSAGENKDARDATAKAGGACVDTNATAHLDAAAAAELDTEANLDTESKADADTDAETDAGKHADSAADALTSDASSGRVGGSSATEALSSSSKPSPAVYAPIFRALLSACGRCGSVEQALRVLELMSRAHVRPDSAMLCTVVSSFAMDGGGMDTPLALKMLDWNALRAQQAENEAFSRRVGRRRSSIRSSAALAAAGSASARAGSAVATPTSVQTSVQTEAPVSQSSGVQHAVATEPAPQSENRSSLLLRSFAQSESLLTRKFPDLAIDTDRETCPACGTKLTLVDVQRGFSTERSDYTTQCPAVDCGRRFVGRFTVHSRSQRWAGSTGQFTPLFCEFLSPWALAKEVRTVVHDPEIDGIEMLCSAAFSRKSPVIFWNLMLYWRQFVLPFGFLLAGAPDEE